MSSSPRFATQADLGRIAEFNRTDAEFPRDATLHQLIQAQVQKSANRTAVLCEHDRSLGATSLTYAELNVKANQLARRLRAEGVAPGQVVALLVERSFAMMIGILAIIKAGGAYLPISPDNPPERAKFILTDADAKILLVHESTKNKAPATTRVINLDDKQSYDGSADDLENLNRPDGLAYVIYTSGSTGKPKGVMIEHRSVINRLVWMQHAYPISERDVLLQKTPYYFDVSVWELFWWTLAGAKLCFLAPGAEGNPLAIVGAAKNHGVTVLHFVPSMLSVFLEYLDGKDARVMNDLASVRQVFASGEALTPSHVRKFNDIWGGKTGARLTNLYGPTEATVDVTYFDCPRDDNFNTIPIGRPIHNTRLYVMKDGHQVAIGDAGELCISGVGLARGYLNNPAFTSEKFVDNPSNPGERIYRTGDVARWLPDGNVEYLGREDHQVKIRGLRIELGEIENTIREYAGVTDCVAVVKKYSENVILIVAYVVGNSKFNLEELKQHLRTHLPAYMIPSHIEKIEKMPLTASGKTDRNALPEPALQLKPS